MPSWNVHIAHTERLLAQSASAERIITDRDAFVLGNLVPDIYVGYMVPDVSHKIPYKDTHYANPDFVPAPDASLFYRQFVRHRQATDLTLGAWCHLLCDHYYNLRTIQHIASIGVKTGERTRIRKQADFDLYGRTLDITLVPELTADVLRQCACFEQYDLDEADVRASVVAAEDIVRNNRTRHVAQPHYDLLTEDFFAKTSAEVDAVLEEALDCYVGDRDAAHLGCPPA